MTTSPKVDRPVLDIDPRWCWSRLRSIREGVLVFSSSGRPMTLAVTYAIDRQRVVIAMAPGSAAGWRADESRVSLEVVGSDRDRGRWVVRATGQVRRDLSSRRDVRLLAPPLERLRLVFDPPPHQLTMPLARVSGFYESAPFG